MNHEALWLYYPLVNFESIQTVPHIKSDCVNIDPNLEMVIVAPGPSLGKHLDKIRDCKGRIPIVALQRSVPILKRHGVVPDFIVTLDSGILPHEHLQALEPDDFWNTIAILAYGVNPAIYNMFTYVYTVASQLQYDALISDMLGGDCCYVLPMSTVLPLAINVCAMWQASKVWVVGSDLKSNSYFGGEERDRDNSDLINTMWHLRYFPNVYFGTEFHYCSDVEIPGWHNSEFEPNLSASFKIQELIDAYKMYDRKVVINEDQKILIDKYRKVFDKKIVDDIEDVYSRIEAWKKKTKT